MAKENRDWEKRRAWFREYARKNRAANLEAVRAYQREWRRRWREKNRERHLAYKRAWQKRARAKNPEKFRAYLRDWSKRQRKLRPNLYGEANKRWKTANPEKAAAIRLKTHLKRRFQISPEEYNSLFKLHNGQCAICGAATTPRGRLHVDHCHVTGVIRGILCGACNWGLGSFRDDPERLRRAADYVEKFKPTQTAVT